MWDLYVANYDHCGAPQCTGTYSPGPNWATISHRFRYDDGTPPPNACMDFVKVNTWWVKLDGFYIDIDGVQWGAVWREPSNIITGIIQDPTLNGFGVQHGDSMDDVVTKLDDNGKTLEFRRWIIEPCECTGHVSCNCEICDPTTGSATYSSCYSGCCQ